MEDRTKTGTNLKLPLTRETKIYLSRFASSSGNLLSTFRRIYTSNLTTREQRETQYLYARASSSSRCSSDEDARAIIAFIGEKLRLSGLASFRLLRGPTIYANVLRVFLLYPLGFLRGTSSPLDKTLIRVSFTLRLPMVKYN